MAMISSDVQTFLTPTSAALLCERSLAARARAMAASAPASTRGMHSTSSRMVVQSISSSASSAFRFTHMDFSSAMAFLLAPHHKRRSITHCAAISLLSHPNEI